MAGRFSDLIKAGWSPWIFAMLAALLVFITEQIIEHFARQSTIEREQAHVLNHLATVRARLEGVINSNLLMIHGIAAVIAAQPDIDQEGFALIARGLMDKDHALRNITAAPDMVISLIYPIAGNEAAIGLDYRTHPTQKDAAIQAMRRGQSILTGPVPLVQGGQGIIAREPVFIPDFIRNPQDGRRLFHNRWMREQLMGSAGTSGERKKMEGRLRQQLDELTRWQSVMLNREERIHELKAEVNALLAMQARTIRYPSQADRP